MKLTFIGLNSWLLSIDNLQILIDPWLVDSVIFYGSPWLFEVKSVNPPCYTPETLPSIDLILISQSLDDHCHQPTLARLSKQIPVIAAPSAVKIVKKMGYDRVIPQLTRSHGSIDDFAQLLGQSQLSTQLLVAHPGESVSV